MTSGLGLTVGPLCYLAGQLVSDYEVLGDAAPPGSSVRRPLEEALTALRKGALLLKHGRHGKPKVHYCRVVACDTLLKWRSASGSLKQVKLRSVSEVVAGQTTEVFRRYPVREAAGATRSLSLHYKDEEGSSRTLDLTCADEQQFELWFTGLRVLAARLRSLGAPVPVGPAAAAAAAAAAAVAAAGAAAPPPLGSLAGPGGATPGDVARCVEKTRSLQRQGSSGLSLSVPAVERVPCDLLAWGSAQRAPPTAASLRSVAAAQEDCWQHRSLPGPGPGSAQLDAYRAAVGRKHAAVITATGAVYAWGEGRGGKLGLGHDQDQPQPQRVRHGLEGRCVVAVACGDDCTAALTEGGELFMWGRLHVDSRPQLVPLLVRGDLWGRRIVQISCGPFHCAAVSSEGQLFTWGEGFGGKLGHGDQASRAQPALVQALAGRQVLEAACGVWHTAAIVADPEGSSPFGPLLGRASPLRGDASAPDVAALPPDAADGAPGPAAPPPASPLHHGAAHARNNSTSSAFSEASLVHEGQGGALYTWGGVNESVAFGSSEKHDSNKGCLGHGDVDLYRGQLLPARVGGALEHRQVRHVAAGSHLTVAVTTGGRVFQMGVTGASAPSRHCPWEGAAAPELVRGPLQGVFIDEVACGMHHVVAIGRALDRRAGRPGDHAPRLAFAWGRGSEGQLGVKSFEDSAAPVQVEGLKGRSILQVTCGGSNTMAVCEHSMQRWEPDSKEEAEAASRALCALTAEPKQLRIQAPGDPAPSLAGSRRESERGGGMMGAAGAGGGAGGGMGIVRRSFSLMSGRASMREGGGGGGSVAGGAAALAGPLSSGGAPDLSRASSGSVRSLGGASMASGRGPSASFSHYYTGPHQRSSMGHHPGAAHGAPAARGLQRLRSDRAAAGSAAPSSEAGHPRLVSIGSPSKSAGGAWGHAPGTAGGSGRRSTYAGHSLHHLTSARSFTLSGGAARSDISSLSSWQHRPHSDAGEEHEADSGGANGAVAGGGGGGAHRTLSSSADLAGILDDVRSGSSMATLHDELAEKNRIIERLQRKLEKMQRQQQQQQQPAAAAAAAARTDSGRSAEERLRESVLVSAGAFRELQQQQAGPAPPPGRPEAGGSHPPRPRTSPGAGRAPGLRASLSPSSSAGRDGDAAAAAAAGAAGGTAAAGSDGQASLDKRVLHTMEEMLRIKEAHLAGQQAKLQQWAAELQAREAALAAQQAQLAAGSSGAAAPTLSPGSSRGGVPPPIASESPVLPAGRAVTPPAPASIASASPLPASLSPAVRRVLAETIGAQQPHQQQQSPLGGAAAAAAAAGSGPPSSNGSAHGGAAGAGSGSAPGTVPDSPAAMPGEWTEELEQGVFLTFITEAGARKLKRIRFSRSLFSADSAKAWYEANKHRLAADGTPRSGAAPSLGPAGSAGGSVPGSQPDTPSAPAAAAAAAAKQRQEQQEQEQQEQQEAAEGSGGRAVQLPADLAAIAASLHYRQTSRNLSFDARELAAFHEKLLAAREQQQQQQQQAVPGLPRPSRLSKSTPAAAAPVGDEAGAGPAVESPEQAQQAQQEGEQWATPRGGGEEGAGVEDVAAAAEGGSGGYLSAHSTPLAAGPQRPPSGQGGAAPAEPPAAAAAGSGGSSPIRASRSSGSPSALTKQLTASSSALKAAAGGQPLFTPRSPQLDKQLSAAAAAGAAAAASSGSSSQQSSPPSQRSSGSLAQRLRRSLTGGGKIK